QTSSSGVTVRIVAPTEVSCGDTFEVAIEITRIENLNTVEFNLGFDPLVFEVSGSPRPGDLTASATPMGNLLSPGNYRIVLNVPGLAGVNGAGSLAKIDIKSIGTSSAASKLELAGFMLTNTSALVIPVDAIIPAQVSVIAEVPTVNLVFASDRTGDYEVYLMDDNGEAVTQLTDAPGIDWQPALSPDGTQVAFVSDREGNSDIYLMGNEGGGLKKLTESSAEDIEPDFSPDGTQIVFSSNRDGDYEIYLLDVNDQEPPAQLTQNTAQDRSPSFFPDGTQIVFVSDQDGNNEIYAMDVNGNGVSRLTSTNYPVDNSQPCFSPDGIRIAFSSNRSGNYDIYLMDSNGKNPESITSHAANDMEPSFSPNGNIIAFTSDRGGNQEIYIINIDTGGEPENLTNHLARDIHPSFGLDSSPIAPTGLTIITTGFPEAKAGVFYYRRVLADGGIAPYTWSVYSGSLPQGLSLASDGVISGTPLEQGTFSFTLQVEDVASQRATKSLSLSVRQAHGWEMAVGMPTSHVLNSVTMVSATNGWAVGSTILHWDGVSWSEVSSPTSNYLLSVTMTGPTDGWAVGGDYNIGTILHWDGASWSKVSSPTSNRLYSVTMTGPTDGWAVGDRGIILHWDGASWSEVSSPTSYSLHSVTMTGPTDGWAVGDRGIILHWDGASWSEVSSPTSYSLNSVTMTGPTDGWAVGYMGTILHWDGNSWSEVSSPTSNWLSSVTMTGPTDGWAVSGTILHWDGASWSEISSPTSNWLESVDMLSPTDGWAVGNGGTILRFVGDQQADTTPPTAFDLLSPADNSRTDNPRPTFTWQASSDLESGITWYELWIDGAKAKEVAGTLAIPEQALSVGEHTWYVVARNDAGLTTQSNSFTLTVDQINISNGIVAYYPFNGNANDESGNGNHGIVYGSTLTKDRFGNSNSAYSFDGINNYIEVPTSSWFKFNGNITVSLWMKVVQLPSDSCCEYYILSKMYSKYPNIFGFNMALSTYNNYNCLFFRATESTNWGDWHIGNSIPFSQIPTNQYVHIAFTYDSSRTKSFLNGQLYNTNIDPGGKIGYTDESLLIGYENWSSDSSRYFNGVIDEVRIYNRALSEPEIQELYNERRPQELVITNLLPEDSARLGSNDVTFTWQTNQSTSSTVFLKKEAEASYSSYTGDDGLFHTVTV
ncbi:MAG: DPP IV N-terminal domain-containing protein, partial [bacterium]|nr:DPP IV N-terminal domain-containing protein [bacterium]